MARYIDADELIRLIGIDALCYKPYSKRDAIACVKTMPTADVAPRAEVNEAYWEGVEYGNKDGAALVAREIFEEIKDQLRGIFDFFRQDNDIRESCAIMFAISEVDKIEKKYTQPEPPKGD